MAKQMVNEWAAAVRDYIRDHPQATYADYVRDRAAESPDPLAWSKLDTPAVWNAQSRPNTADTAWF